MAFDETDLLRVLTGADLREEIRDNLVSFRWATVTSLDPLQVRREGEFSDIDITGTSIPVEALRVGDRVRVSNHGSKAFIETSWDVLSRTDETIHTGPNANDKLREDIAEQVALIDAAQEAAQDAVDEAGQALAGLAETVVSTTLEYVLSTSETDPPLSGAGWSETSPTRTPGTYIWMRVKATRANEQVVYSEPSLVTGNDGAPGEKGDKGDKGEKGDKGDKGETGSDGAPGAAGVGLESTEVTYAQSTSATVAPTTGWTSAVPTLTKGHYLWTRSVWTYTDTSTETGYSVAYIARDGAHGNDGLPGAPGVGITETAITYAQSTSGTEAPTTGWGDEPPDPIAGRYVWTKTVWTYTDGSTETGYSVGKIGDTGEKGDKGETGEQGAVSFLHVAYADSADGTLNFSTTDPNRLYVGTYTANHVLPGGRNLIPNSVIAITGHSGGTSTPMTGVETPFGVHDVRVFTRTGTHSLIRVPGVVEHGVEQTFSIWARTVNEGEQADVRIDIADIAQSATRATSVGNSWTRIVETQTPPIGHAYDFVDVAINTPDVPVIIAFWKLERGNKATDWTPAPEDLAADPTDPALYNWTLVKGADGADGLNGVDGEDGADGRAITGTTYHYQASPSGTAVPTGSWSTTPPAASPGQYVWTRTTFTFDKAPTTAYTYAVGKIGETGGKGDKGDKGDKGSTGDTGSQGISVTAVTPYYATVAEGASAPTQPTTQATPPSPWTTTEPTFIEGRELWRTERISFSNGTYSWTTRQKSSAYAAAVQAVNLSEAAAQGLVVVSEDEPDHYKGRIWWQLNSSGNGIGIKISNGSIWQSYAIVADQVLVPSSVGAIQLKDGAVTADKVTADSGWFTKLSALSAEFNTAFANKITADTIGSGTLEGVTIYSPNSTSLPRVKIANSTIEVIRDDGDGGAMTTIALGGTSADKLVMRDSAGLTKMQFDADAGTGTVAGQMSVGSLTVGGDNLTEILDATPKGVLAYMRAANDSDRAGSSLLGYIRLTAPIRSDRMYRLSISGMLAATNAGDRAYVQINNVSRGIVMNAGNFDIPTTTARYVSLETVFAGDINAQQAFGVLFRNATANRAIFWSGRANYPVTAYIEDLGPKDFAGGIFDRFGLTPLSSGTNTNETPVSERVKVYNATSYRVWRGSTLTTTPTLEQGYYGGVYRYSTIGFGGTTLTSDLSGATVKKVEVRLRNDHWWSGAGGTVRVGSTRYDTTRQTSGTVATTAMPRYADMWVPVGGFSNNFEGITLGAGSNTSTTYYGKFTKDVQLRVTYEK